MAGKLAARRMGVRLFRVALLAAVVVVLRWGSGPAEVAIDLDALRLYFPDAFAIEAEGDGWHRINAENGDALGYAMRSLPETKHIVGYAGPTDVLIALAPEQRVKGVGILSSGDTRDHVKEVLEDEAFLAAFNGWTWNGDNDVHAIDAVSGATLTSLAIVESVAVRLGGEPPALKFPDAVTLEDAQHIFPEVAKLGEAERTGAMVVKNEEGQLLGRLLRTSPYADDITGYQGPSDTLIGVEVVNGALSPSIDMVTLRGIHVLSSYDNQRYVDYVREDRRFPKTFDALTNFNVSQEDFDVGAFDGVSGATMTSDAVAHAVVRRLRVYEDQRDAQARMHYSLFPRPLDTATLFAIALGCILAFTPLRAQPKFRWAIQAYMVLVLGLWTGDLVSLALFGGWTQGALPLRSAPGLIAIAAASLLLPWATGRPVYCAHICPHGIAQQWLYKLVPFRVNLSLRFKRVLRVVPLVLLAAATATLAARWPLSLTAIEPFDAWVIGVGGIAAIIIAVVGLAFSAVSPHAYCKFGCPTGLLLEYVRARKGVDSLDRRDAIACALLLSALLLRIVTS